MRILNIMMSCCALVAASTSNAQQSIGLTGTDAVIVMERAIAAVLADSSRFRGAIPSNAPLYLDTTTTFYNLRGSGVADGIALNRPLQVGRNLAVESRAAVLDCPTAAISSDCVFRGPGTSIWLGKPKRIFDEVAIIVHVMRPAPAMSSLPSRLTGFSVEVILRKSQDGSWTAVRFGKVVAG